MLDYVCKPVGGEVSISEETSESRWISKDRILDLVTKPLSVHVLKHIWTLEEV